MKKLLLIFILGFLLIGCKNPKSEKSISELFKELDSLEVIKSKKIDDSTTNFKKWVDGKDIEYVHLLFMPDVKKGLDYLSLKPRSKSLSVIIKKYKYEGQKVVYPSITRYESAIDVEFSSKDINDYETRSSFRVIITSKKGDTAQIFKEREDSELLELISKHTQDKIQIEEFFMREVTGHFEGDKELPVKKVRSFYLSDENKQALKESNAIIQLLKENL